MYWKSTINTNSHNNYDINKILGGSKARASSSSDDSSEISCGRTEEKYRNRKFRNWQVQVSGSSMDGPANC